MSELETGAPRRRVGRGLKLALAVSLALNLAVVGLVLGIAAGRDRGGDGPPALRALGLGPVIYALPRDERRDLRERLQGSGEDLLAERRAIGRALADLRDALRAEPFDRAVAERALERARASAMALQRRGHGVLIEHVTEMSAQDRADLADRLERVMQRLGNGRGRGD